MASILLKGFGSALGDLGEEMVSLLVGPEMRKFFVHKKLLCRKIPYFEAMFGGCFKEAEEGVAYLIEDDPEAIELIVDWLYQGFLSPPMAEEGSDRLISRALARSAVARWTQVFFVAEKYCIDTLMDETLTIIKSTHKKNHMYFNCQAMGEGYNSTREGSRLRLYILRTLCYITLEKDNSEAWPTSEIQKLLKETPDLSDGLLAAIRGHRHKRCQKPHEFPMCDYHQHGSQTPCPYQTRNVELMVTDPVDHMYKKRKMSSSPVSEMLTQI